MTNNTEQRCSHHINMMKEILAMTSRPYWLYSLRMALAIVLNCILVVPS